MKKLTLLILSLTASITTCAQQLNLPKNKQFEIVTKSVQHGNYKGEDESSYAFKSLGKDTSGNNILECKLVKSIIKDNHNQSLLNTDSIYNISLNNTIVLFPLAILNQPFKVIVDPRGKVIEISEIEPAFKTTIGHWNLTPQIEQHLTGRLKTLLYTIQELFLEFPEKNLAIVSEWKNKDSGISFKLESKTGNPQIINSYKKDSSGFSIDGKYAFDSNTGLVQNAQIETKYDKIIQDGVAINRNGGVKTTQKINNNITKLKTDTSWINMAVKFSPWSSSIKNEMDYDSIKIAAAFKANDEKFGKDRYYMVNKLDLTQKFNNKHYDSLILLTPNKYLKGTHHLYNKLDVALSTEGATAAYDVSKYQYKTTSFTNWLQESFAQHFLNDNGAASPEKNKSRELLELFMKDKDSIYQEKVKALYLWTATADQLENTALVIKNAAEFNTMSDAQIKNGNGSRYALLMYKFLLKANAQTEADSLLNLTIRRLEKYTSDASNPIRYAEQNVLAYAWYLKYETTLNTDSTLAINYLAKASNYSPKGKNEKSYTSFYDRFFLNSKESYRDDYLNTLLKVGNEAEALQIFAVQINANPESLADMQKLYEKRFNNKNFKSFLIKNVIGNWTTAPDFKLSNIDGKEHSLTDFKEKWLVLDFWGTWCGPCKEELPSVNKFYLEIKDGNHGDINFLSIACYDRLEQVKNFINANKYAIPVAMSDEKVEKDYKITGYPSKILISPEGKMLNVDYGKDWKKILKDLKTIYAQN